MFLLCTCLLYFNFCAASHGVIKNDCIDAACGYRRRSYGIRSGVCVYVPVCVLGTPVSCSETVEPLEMLHGAD